MGFNEYRAGGLGATGSPNLVKSQGDLSLLSYSDSVGAKYAIIRDYGQPNMEKVFPSEQKPAMDGSTTFCRDSMEAFAEFDRLAAVFSAVVSDESGVQVKAGSHEELDQMLLAMAELPEDIVVEIQRVGRAPSGRPKYTLNLQYNASFIGRMFGGNQDGLRLARIYYESYPKDARLNALRDLRDRVAANYLTGELLSSLLMTSREKQQAYLREVRAGTVPAVALSEYMDSTAVVDGKPLLAVRVRFVDQNGNEVPGLPYEVSARGVLNFSEAVKRTNQGAMPGNFSAGETLIEQGMSDMEATDTFVGAGVEWEGRRLNPGHHYHLLYAYRARTRSGTPQGTVKISITTPRNVNSDADWGNDRLMVYSEVADASESRSQQKGQAQPLMLLYSHNIRLSDGGSPERITVTVPVHIEPLPMHLVESPKGSGNIVSKWSVAEDIGMIPSHQKVALQLTVLRPKASEKWEEADAMLPDTRNGYMDRRLQYEEFVSPEGRAAYRDSITESTPVRGIRFALVPDEGNTWIVGRQAQFIKPDSFGVMRADLVPGRYALKMLVEIKSDGTTGMRLLEGNGDPDRSFAVRFDSLPSAVKDAVRAKYGDQNLSIGSLLVPETLHIGTLEAPAAFYYRKTSDKDTTPIGAVGVKLLKSSSVMESSLTRFRDFELKSKVPALLAGQTPEVGSIYDLLGVNYPAINQGWPGDTEDTDETIFDTANVYLAPDSSIDLSLLESFEQRYQAERDASGGVTPGLRVPAVGTRIAFMGFWIEHAWFDTAIGPNLRNQELVLAGGVHEYDMGKIESQFYDESVVRVLCYYPQTGVIRRRVKMESSTQPSQAIVASSVTSFPSYNPASASMDRVYHFKVESSPEAAILTGRWVPVEQGYGDIIGSLPRDGADSMAFNAILDEIRRGGGPLRGLPGVSGAIPKWNQFWSSTADGWMLGGDPVLDGAASGIVGNDAAQAGTGASAISNAQGQVSASAGTSEGVVTFFSDLSGTFEGEKGAVSETLYAPQPVYNEEDDETFGFIGGGI